MDLYPQIHRLLREIGSGRIPNTAYDTAWVARLGDLDGDMSERALEWLRANQLPDGCWGAENPRYHHDRLICTLAAMTAFARWGNAQDEIRWQRARVALGTVANGLSADPAGGTIGFEMIVPTLLSEANTLGVIEGEGSHVLGQLERHRAAKLVALPNGTINRFVTVAFSAEMAGPDGLHLLDTDNLLEKNGSVGNSPSATAYYVRFARPDDRRALDYLRSIVTEDGGVPDVAPFDIFEQTWTLWNLSLTGPLDDATLALCQPHLDFLENAWVPGEGAGFAAGYAPKDGDETGAVYDVLTRFGRSVDLKAVLSYQESDHFRCFALEANPSISANVHILSALREAGLPADHPAVQTALRFLRRTQTIKLFWFDKWHASPYYPTTHLIIACAGYADYMVDNAIYWLLETQNQDGSWGYYMPTAEETAYCLQALAVWKQHGHHVPGDVLERGAAWLVDRMEPPYPPLWIGKCLYCPVLVVRSAILSALTLVTQG